MPEPKVILITGASRGIGATLALSCPARRYRNNWFSIILHSGQSIYFLFLILGLVLGLA